MEVNRGRVYTYTYDATLDPQQKYRVSVRADTEGLQSSSVQKEFSTSGTTVLAWDDTYCTAYLPSENKNDKISADYDWASYKDGKHVALYTWHLSTEKYAETAYQKFFTTESDTASFPEDFRKAYDESAHPETLCDPMDAWWVWLEAEVYNLDEKGNPTYGKMCIRDSLVSIVLIIIYIAIRFDYKMGITAIVAVSYTHLCSLRPRSTPAAYFESVFPSRAASRRRSSIVESSTYNESWAMSPSLR